MVKYVEFGDIFNFEDIHNFAHGCNCAGAMGKGIAVQFKDKFPEMYREYKSLCKDGRFNLGDLFAFQYDKGYIFNLGTQASWRTKADIDSLQEALLKMLLFASNEKLDKIALPKIGAGLGGLVWEEVKDVINQAAKGFPEIELIVVENFKSI
jgi:O-acetyl-ADP-ribose deacetylase (regulator of RNase III)